MEKKEKKDTTLSDQFQNAIDKRQHSGNIDTPNRHIHYRSCSWLGTDTSITSGGDKLVLWVETFTIMINVLIISVTTSGVSDCCLTPTQQFFSYIMTKTSQ